MSDYRDKLMEDCRILERFVRRLNEAGLYGKYSIKGSILLHFLQHGFNEEHNNLFRYTKDMDIDICKFDSEKIIKETIINAIKGLDVYGEVIDEVLVLKEPGEKRTAWLIQCYKFIYEGKAKKKVFKLDINSSGFNDDNVTLYSIGGNSFYGSTVDKILVDKLVAISTPYVKNRVKDLVDVAILKNFEYDTNKVINSVLSSKSYGDFEYFINNYKDLEEAIGEIKTHSKVSNEEIMEAVMAFVKLIRALRGPRTGIWGDFSDNK